MAEYQWATGNGDIIQAEYDSAVDSLDSEEVLGELETVFNQFGHHATCVRNDEFSDVYKVVFDNNQENSLLICAKATTPGGRSTLKNEQRIQPLSNYINYVHARQTEGQNALLLGVYKRDGQTVFCGWLLKPSSAESTPISKQIKIDTIAQAMKNGFAQQKKSNNEYVCAFRKEFIFFYLHNIKRLHGVAVEALGEATNVVIDEEYYPESYENDFKEWFKKQVKKDGTPYSMRSYDNYVASFKYAFKKLEDKLEGFASLFDVKDIATFDVVENIIKEDESYESDLKLYSHNSLPAGLAKYRQYLLEKQGAKRVHFGTNRIFYGVPGSGKSYTIEQEVKDCYTKRVVFHPDYTYFDFVGQILPKAVNGRVQYDFTAGPFTEILDYAENNPTVKCVLIIEELNRGNAPAIFGELFQLLDRCEDEINLGESRYGITNHEIAKEVYGDKDEIIKLPSNLSIFATMNTSDQNVFTLDTAFQRRWWMKYIPNKFSKDQKRKEIAGSKICWGAFAITINNIMHESNDGIGSTEDKSLGAYFAQNKDFEKGRFSEKVIKYLWDDAFKMDRTAIFSSDYVSFEQLIGAYQDENTKDCLKEILREDVYERMLLKNKEILQTEETAVANNPEQIEVV